MTESRKQEIGRALAHAIAERDAAETIYKTAAKRHNRAFQSINGTAPVDARRFTLDEYRFYAEMAIKARKRYELLAEKVDSLSVRLEAAALYA